MSIPKLEQFSPRVKSLGSVSEFTLRLFVIERHKDGQADEMIYLPLCSRCGRPITQFNSANLVVENADLRRLKPVGKVYGVPLLYQPGRVQAFHLDCDEGGIPWKRLDTVLRSDQRYEWEKLS